MSCKKKESCPQREIVRLADLFKLGRIAEAEVLAKSLTRRFPQDGAGWKLLGAVLHSLGRAGETVMAFQKAAKLLPDDVEAHFNLSLALQTQGQLAAAATSYRRTLALQPDIAVAHGNLGNVLQAQGKFAEAETCYRRALALQPDFLAAQYNLGSALEAQGRFGEAEACYRLTIRSKPDFVEGHCNLGIALQAQGRLAEAEACFRTALELQAGSALAHYNLACNLGMQGRFAEAEAGYRRTLAIAPDLVTALGGLGDTLQELGRVAEAEAVYLGALKIDSGIAETNIGLGDIRKQQGRLAEAQACYRRALEIKPGLVKALNHLAAVLLARGESMAALDLVRQSLRTNETWEAKLLFVDCVRRGRWDADAGDVREWTVRALAEPWSSPVVLARFGATLVKRSPDIGAAMSRAVGAWPRRITEKELFGEYGVEAVAENALLQTLLVVAPICDVELEQFLTTARRALLNRADGSSLCPESGDSVVAFFCNLARQCFINEYVFDATDDEERQAERLRDSLAAALAIDAPISVFLLLGVAAYFPLHSISYADRLVSRAWPETVVALLVQQVGEPAQERGYRDAMPRLTSIQEGVSLAVGKQYGENPYPRWILAEPPGKPVTVDAYLGRQFPGSVFQPIGKDGELDILIAGCGTGQNSINTAQRFHPARILAIDLSLASLCYAMRKTHALGLTSVEYAQADIMNLGTFDRRFDVIESYGVLHHLADPYAGWRVLLALLRPGGAMRLGLYSALARTEIVTARATIADEKLGAEPKDIRRFRQRVMQPDEAESWGFILNTGDFFSTSGCRDLLFHVQEHRLLLGEIAAFLQANDLKFLGFEIDDVVLQAYRRRFPEDPAATSLDNWEVFERERPETFGEMYRFCVQKGIVEA